MEVETPTEEAAQTAEDAIVSSIEALDSTEPEEVLTPETETALEIANDYIEILEAGAKKAVLHWREVIKNDFDSVTGGDTEAITEELAQIINLI